MTSLQQPCDLWTNQPLKRYVKEEYYKYRISLNLAEQRCLQVKVPRETFVKWVEEGIQYLSKLQHNTRAVAKTFSKCDLDPHDDEKVLFDNHLKSISQIHLYHALTKNHKSAVLEF